MNGSFAWQWPWVAAGAAAAAVLLIVLVAFVVSRRRRDDARTVFSLDDDLGVESASRLLRAWRAGGRAAVALAVLALALAVSLVARPSAVDRDEERSSSRDIVLCLDVSGSTLPYDRQVIDTYRDLVGRFRGERIGMAIFNSTTRTVFPLTDDYDLVSRQLSDASDLLKGVQSQDDIDRMSDRDYQRVSDWLDGTQNRRDATSLIGDGLVSCAAMLPGFAYGSGDGTAEGKAAMRHASIVLATDNVVSGTPSYTLAQALDLTSRAGIAVDGLYSGPPDSEHDDEARQMSGLIEDHGGAFLTRSDGGSVDELVRSIDERRRAQDSPSSPAALTDAPGWWTLALAAAVTLMLTMVWRLRR